MHGGERVELEHRRARERHDGGESLSKVGIGELAEWSRCDHGQFS